MAMQLAPSGLATALQKTTYSPEDILKYQKAEKREERLITEKREYDTLNKLYDSQVALKSGDYGVFNDRIQQGITEAFTPVVEGVKSGGSAIDYLSSFDPVLADISKAREINKNEKKRAAYIESNILTSPEGKQKALADIKEQWFNEDGSKKTLEEVYDLSKNMKIDMSKYVDSDAPWKHYMTTQGLSKKQVKLPNGVGSTSLYNFQKIDDDGNVVTDIETDKDNIRYGFVTDEVYDSFMSNEDRAAKIEQLATEFLKEEGQIDNLDNRDRARRSIVTNMHKQFGEQGSAVGYTPDKKTTYGDTYYENKNPYTYTTQLDKLYNIAIPTMEESEEIPNTDGLYGVNVTAELNALNPKKLIKAGFLDTDGVYHVSTEDDWMNMDDPLWIESTDFTTVVSSTSKLDVLKQLERYRPKTITKEATKTTPKKEFNPSSYRNSKSATGKKISDVVYNKEDKTYKVSYYGEKPETLSQEEWDKLEGGLQSAPPKMKKEQ